MDQCALQLRAEIKCPKGKAKEFVLVKFTSGPDFPAELDRVLGITDGILRSLITRRPE